MWGDAVMILEQDSAVYEVENIQIEVERIYVGEIPLPDLIVRYFQEENAAGDSGRP
ncbi:hypothetical protein [Caproicibacterium lactatifermentans]|uniref:hypothetical protein n=1 Tax=Caproicibacterium lactatifermentans TaxID=2666138 RepID=UPI003D92E0CE